MRNLMPFRSKGIALFLVTLVFLLLLVTSCGDKCEVSNTYVYYEPVYSTSAEIKTQVGMRAAQDIKNPSRIYFKDGFLFINENGEGIHIIDNRDPANPVKKSFLNIPGNY